MTDDISKEVLKDVGVSRTRVGVVISKSGDKSIVVRGERRMRHPVYGKVVRQFRKYHVNDEKNIAEIGDTVEIVECRPISKTKRWRLVGKVNVTAKGEK